MLKKKTNPLKNITKALVIIFIAKIIGHLAAEFILPRLSARRTAQDGESIVDKIRRAGSSAAADSTQEF